MLNKLLKTLLKNWVLKNFPKETKTKYDVEKVKTILIKKGKIKEWRSYDVNHNRIDLIK